MRRLANFAGEILPDVVVVADAGECDDGVMAPAIWVRADVSCMIWLGFCLRGGVKAGIVGGSSKDLCRSCRKVMKWFNY